MKHSPNHVAVQLISTLKQLTTAAALIVGLISLLVLSGWAFDLALIKSLLPGLVTMKPFTAIGCLLAAIALWLLR